MVTFVVYAQRMNRRTFLASLVGVAIVPAVPAIAPPSTFSFTAEIRRPVLAHDELSRYVEALTREQHARLNQRSLDLEALAPREG